MVSVILLYGWELTQQTTTLRLYSRLAACPEKICVDCGTENGHVTHIQMFLKRNNNNTFSKYSFIYECGMGNKGIESRCEIRRKLCVQLSINMVIAL